MRVKTPANVLAISLACALTACGGGATLPGPRPTQSGGGSPIDQVVAANYPGGWGVELAIYKHGNPVYVHGYGLRDRGLPDSFGGYDFWGVTQPDKLFDLTRGQLAPDANTVFDLASVSKEFTAGAVLLLQQDGKLSVNDPLSKYFPSFPNGAQLSLVDLLHHQSGLVNYNTFGQYPDFSGAYHSSCRMAKPTTSRSSIGLEPFRSSLRPARSTNTAIPTISCSE